MSYAVDIVPPLTGYRAADTPDISDVILAELTDRLRADGFVVVYGPPMVDGVAAFVARQLAQACGEPVRFAVLADGVEFWRGGA